MARRSTSSAFARELRYADSDRILTVELQIEA